MNRILILTMLLLGFTPIYGQASFTESSLNLANAFVTSGSPMAVADMNGDGLDDIVRLHQTNVLTIDLQDPSGIFQNNITGIQTAFSNWSMCIGDYDNNGYNDILLGTANIPMSIVTADNTGSNYTQTTLGGPPIFAQGSNFADIDNDGNLDLFVCNDNGLNSVYRNNGLGELIYDTLLIYTPTAIPSDNSGNYATIWTDYDNDRDLDLYISKCRLGVNDIQDPRRVNMLFENDGNGNYTEVAALRGLVPFAQTWATSFGDIDNDGDLDIFMINHDTTSRLYENDGKGNFSDITPGAGFSPSIDNLGLGLQCKFMDFDNDGFVDLNITSSQGGYKYFHNNGNNTFTAIFGMFQTNTLKMHSMAIGDLNNDGFMDVIAGFGSQFNGSSTFPDRLYLNNGNGNNWLKTRLIGTESNRSAIGARVEIFGPFGMMVREVRSGEGYGISNSLIPHFGLGSNTVIDSLVVFWPSGNTSKITNPGPNQTIQLVEEGCPQVTSAIAASICNGNSYPFGNLILTGSGVYEQTFVSSNGCDSIVQLNLSILDIYESSQNYPLCESDLFPLPDGSNIAIESDTMITVNLLTVNNCDSIVHYDISLLQNYSQSESVSACANNFYTFPDGSSSIITAEQVHVSSLTSSQGCDSIITTQVSLIITPIGSLEDQICSGDTYVFPNGTSLEIIQDYNTTISIQSSNGCDSIIHVNLQAIPTSQEVSAAKVCFGDVYFYPDGTSSAPVQSDLSHSSLLTSSIGCDSFIVTNIQVINEIQILENLELCQNSSYQYPDGTTIILTEDTEYQSQLISMDGCDSIITSSIKVLDSYDFTLTANICAGESYTFVDGTSSTILEDTIHISQFISFQGCDSLIHTDLKVFPSFETNENIKVCPGESYTFADGTISNNILAPLQQSSILQTAYGCDSIINTLIELHIIYDELIDLSLCQGESLLINGIEISGIESDTIILFQALTTNGCDSLVTLDIMLNQINFEIVLNEEVIQVMDDQNLSYQWVDCNNNFSPIAGETASLFTPIITGSYAVELNNGICLETSQCYDWIINSTKNIHRLDFEIFPNPSNEQIALKGLDGIGQIDCRIINLHGALLKEHKISPDNPIISLETLPNGVYLLMVQQGDQTGVQKLIKL